MEFISRRHLRLVAAFEAAKGLAVMLVGAGVLTRLSSGPRTADAVVRHLPLDPAHSYPRIFIDLMAKFDRVPLWLLAGGAAAYCAIRFAEAWGLWFGRRWASWLGALSGAIYLPFEIYAMLELFSWLTFAVFAINVLIVGVLSLNLWRGQQQNAPVPSGL